ncbi:phage filamentation protein Fil family protein [Citrobacter sp. CFNIH10]|uniref:phage filamentation protein Fil family protein n=1 Tax=Citrobacter sp. CFNIH10 TaxID=1920110 RepID=UPI000CEC8230|nr:phage filamentation protein Fil family protein [Citrobacter sp. CFNIH10]AUZ65643.1 hypothetical protein C2U53_18410 [Citrobacter sp. CFNIH10]EFH5328756.1 hypothetical protein [Escherichia coli]
MKPFVNYLKRQSPPPQLASGSTGWLELPNGQRWNPGHTYKFNADAVLPQKGGNVLRFVSTKVVTLLSFARGRNGR